MTDYVYRLAPYAIIIAICVALLVYELRRAIRGSAHRDLNEARNQWELKRIEHSTASLKLRRFERDRHPLEEQNAQQVEVDRLKAAMDEAYEEYRTAYHRAHGVK